MQEDYQIVRQSRTPLVTLRRCAALAVLAVCLTPSFLATGCGSSRREGFAAGKPAPFVLKFALDASATNRSSLPKELANVGSVMQAIDPDRTAVSLYRFDSDVQEIVAPRTASQEQFLLEVAPSFSHVSPHDGTRIDAVFSVMAEYAAADAGLIVIVVGTDGNGEGMDPAAYVRLAKSARVLAANPRVAAVFVSGVIPANVLRLKSALMPLRPKLHFVGAGGLDASLIASFLHGVGK